MEEENDKEELGSSPSKDNVDTLNKQLPIVKITPERVIGESDDQHEDVDQSKTKHSEDEEGPSEKMEIETQNDQPQTGMSSTEIIGNDDQLLSEISDLVDDKYSENCNETDESCLGDRDQSTGIASTVVNSGIITEENNDKTDDLNETPDQCQDRSILEGNANDCEEHDEVGEDNQETVEKPLVKESPFEKLASLGYVSKGEVEPETKESALQKLVNRGAISITPASGVTSMKSSTSSKTLSITPTKAKYKAGPKSAMIKQKAKQIKIDPGKSVDIEQDFNSLINFLSAGGVDKTIDNSKSDVGSVGKDNSTIENDKIDEPVDSKIETNNHLQESDSTNHDGSISISCGSELSDDGCSVASNISKSDKVEEGSAEILLSASPNVFYNKVQEFNRDMRYV